MIAGAGGTSGVGSADERLSLHNLARFVWNKHDRASATTAHRYHDSEDAESTEISWKGSVAADRKVAAAAAAAGSMTE